MFKDFINLNFEFFIAKKIISGSKYSNAKGTRPIITIATIGIALGIAVMIVALAIVSGFQNQIKAKVVGFGSHIQITSYESTNTFETAPVSKIQPFYPSLDTINGIRHIQPFATKAGIIKKENDLHGIVLKGIDYDFDWDFFNKNLLEGNSFIVDSIEKSNQVVISKTIANKLNLKIKDKIKVHFIQNPPRVRKFIISGIYETGMAQFDEIMVLADIKHIQKLNNWSFNQVSGFEVLLDNYEELENMDDFIYNYIGLELNSQKITDRHQDIFGWLQLQDWNVIIIITLMTVVAGINMISALLILILEKTNMIGMLKALGSNNKSVRKIFLYNGGFLIAKGLFWGNLIGLLLCYLQFKFHIISLPKESYYIEFIPIKMDITSIFLVNISTFSLCLLMLILPSLIISKISPVKAIKFN